VERTRLASERTLMAWIRTSISLIAFGFTIFKFSEYLSADKNRAHQPILSSWLIGLIMIALGLAALTLAWFQHRRETKALEAAAGPMLYSVSGVMAGLIAGLGLIAFVLVLLRH
jgi:putative membrane protein